MMGSIKSPILIYFYALLASDSNPKFLMTQALSFFPATALLLGHVATAMLPRNAL